MDKTDKTNNNTIYKIVLSAMFVAIGVILPFFTGQIQQIGNMLLPMHIPVFLCGLICGWQYGGLVGFLLPLLRSLWFGMPVIYPNAIAMATELATYGLVVGLLYGFFKKVLGGDKQALSKNVFAVYGSMLPAMLLGRLVWGLAEIILLGLGDSKFTWQMFMAGAFLNAIPGIILQLVLVPAIMALLMAKGRVKSS